MDAYHLIIKGRVQGVCYRAWMRERARSLELKGWVRNLPNWTVEAVVQGERELLDKIVEWCHVGPPAASVDDVSKEPAEIDEGLTSFQVRY